MQVLTGQLANILKNSSGLSTASYLLKKTPKFKTVVVVVFHVYNFLAFVITETA